MSEPTIDILGDILSESDTGVKLYTTSHGEVFFPRSQIISTIRERHIDKLVVTEWIAKQKGLI